MSIGFLTSLALVLKTCSYVVMGSLSRPMCLAWMVFVSVSMELLRTFPASTALLCLLCVLGVLSLLSCKFIQNEDKVAAQTTGRASNVILPQHLITSVIID